MIAAGVILLIIGFLFSVTIIGAFIGVPMMMIGGILLIVGAFGRRRTIITNVVQVSTPAPVQPQSAPYSPNYNVSAVSPAIANAPPPALAAAARHCTSCNAPNDPNGRFCNNCGSALAALA